ncbi:class A beta-lactamase, subclass A2 [Flavitalea flava]
MLAITVQAQTGSLKQKVRQIIQSKDAHIGVSIAGPGKKDTFTINGKDHYPLQSVFKFHLALAVLHQVDKGVFFLEQKIFIKKTELLPGMWSPLRVDYPDGNVYLSLGELLRYTVSMSDNNGCDILLRIMGGACKVNEFIHSLGITDVAIVATEEEMHKSWPVQYKNWSTPDAATQLLQQFYSGSLLSPKSRNFLWDLMSASIKSDRIKGMLPPGTIVAHKPGTSDTNEQHVTAATNDIGIVTLPDGRHFTIAVFVSDSKEKDSTNAGIIAEIAKTAWDTFIQKPAVAL